MLSDIKLLKFANGEMIICQVVGYDQERKVYTVKNPVVAHLEQTSNGQISLAFLVWPHEFLASLDKNESLEIKEDSLLVKPLNVVEKIRDAYNEKYGSGLVLAKNLGLGLFK